MEFNTTDQEEIEVLKKWWKENGNSLVTGVAVGLAVLFGWQGWNQYIDNQGKAASQYFEQMQGALIQQQSEKAEGVGHQLLDQYPGTIYAANGALALAAKKVEQGDGAAARVHYQWVIENSSFESPRQLAQLGIARTYLNEGNLEQALRQLAVEGSGIYRSHLREVKGDVLRQQGDLAAARAAYTDALQLADAADARRDLLQIKLDEVKP